MIQIAMLDDEKGSLDLASGAFKAAMASVGKPAEIHPFIDPERFLASLKNNSYDLICLDIIMDACGTSGTEVAAKVRSHDADVPIVFISSNENKVFSCFAYKPIGFIRKSNFLQDTSALVKRFVEEILPNQKEKHSLKIQTKGETLFLDIDRILYVEGAGNYQNFYCLDNQEPVQVRELMNALEEKLKSFGFLRTHKGFLVNSAFITGFGQDYVALQNGKQVPVSRSRHDEVIQEYMALTQNSLI